ncbi:MULTISPECIES: helix-turn-helix domain-containing protein [Burkholderia]|uniref:helix-turn-helix domain-containing protein n=1 Tax=Burkholderia TaxID=32008 RepID=UPI00163E6B81|nr:MULTISPECIES: helix-turn-helix domain-containing protein [Burkholderia]MBJ9926426.1 helix-turn-helix domain-containing protein [Burkholderia cenocepacia]
MSRRPNRAEPDVAFSSELMTKAAAARQLGMSRTSLNRYIAKGRLATVNMDGRDWMRRDDLNAFESEWKRNREAGGAQWAADGGPGEPIGPAGIREPRAPGRKTAGITGRADTETQGQVPLRRGGEAAG